MTRRCPNCGHDGVTVANDIEVTMITRPDWWPPNWSFTPRSIGRVDRISCFKCGWCREEFRR